MNYYFLMLYALCSVFALSASASSASDVPKMPPAQKAVLVTGASTGIGRRITERLSAEGYFVYAGARKASDLQALSALRNVKGVRLDVTNAGDITEAVKLVSTERHGLYALINNAGVLSTGPVSNMPESEFDLVMDVNVRGPYRVTRAFISLILAQKGRVVSVGSTSGVFAYANGSAYTMSKHALEAFTDSFAQEMHPHGVYVSIIEPGAYSTEIYKSAERRGAFDPKYIRNIELKDPDEVAAAVALALSEPEPKRRYLVTPNETEAEQTIRSQIVRLIQLNEGQKYTFDREALIKMLDESLSHSRPRTQ